MRALVPVPVALALLALSCASAPAPAAHAQTAKSVGRAVRLDPRGEVAISTFKGSVEVTTWDRGEVQIDARVESDGTPELVALTDVRIEGGGAHLAIESDYDRAHDWTRRRQLDDVRLPLVRYRIRVPRAARVTIEDHKSDIRLVGLRGPLTLDTHKGRVRIEALEGPIQLSTHKGNVDAGIARLAAHSSFDTHKGTITIRVPPRAGFDLFADLGRRGRLDGPPMVASVRHDDDDDERYSSRVNGGGPRLELSTHKGAFRIATR
jgi:hypothetical protein